MAAMSTYREAIGAAAVRVLAEEGSRSFTHRAVDRYAGLAEGTTSRYARTRTALLTLACDAMFSEDRQDVLAVFVGDGSLITTPSDVIDLMINATTALLQSPERFRARVELQLESLRTPSLRLYFDEARNAFIAPLTDIAQRLGYPEPGAVADRLVTTADSLLLRQLIIGADPLPLDQMKATFHGALASTAPLFGIGST
ncbi:TetR/AcrR family transcriptional regulator (plasmid) [Mycolicibacterium psychrotolerans]|uniref:TetR/AcrR family transcriptional regulator n=1 Tax=Mycolicibacterium psychrotolerans TaxID=216929 RepID=UPI003D66F6DB